MRKIRRHLGWLLVVAMALGLTAVVPSAQAGEWVPACRPELMQGHWYNTERDTVWIVEMDIGFAGGQCTTRPFVSGCTVTCDLGEEVAIDVGEQWIQSVYRESFVTRYLSVRLSHQDGVPTLETELANVYNDSRGTFYVYDLFER